MRTSCTPWVCQLPVLCDQHAGPVRHAADEVAAQGQVLAADDAQAAAPARAGHLVVGDQHVVHGWCVVVGDDGDQVVAGVVHLVAEHAAVVAPAGDVDAVGQRAPHRVVRDGEVGRAIDQHAHRARAIHRHAAHHIAPLRRGATAVVAAVAVKADARLRWLATALVGGGGEGQAVEAHAVGAQAEGVVRGGRWACSVAPGPTSVHARHGAASRLCACR